VRCTAHSITVWAKVIKARYECDSMIVTSNRALEDWYPLFLDDLIASAAMDRLLHHVRVVQIEYHSDRHPPGGRKAA